MKKKKVAIIGSHGLYANYGGWDQLVRNLAEDNTQDVEYLIFNSSDTPKNIVIPEGVKVKWLIFKASGFQGLFYDFWSILISYFKVDTLLLLGTQGILIIPLLRLFKKKNIVSNVGGVEWERPKFNYLAKKYLRLCFNLSFKYSNNVVLDNEYYREYIPENVRTDISRIIPYGGEIDLTLDINDELNKKYSFLSEDFFLSISRSLEDNQLDSLCESFVGQNHKLVLISNFSKSEYGCNVLKKYKDNDNIILIDGLYIKAELDLIRRMCKAYIHTHTLCGTAPSLVEMIVARRPILSFDIPQNRFTLNNEGYFFKSFTQLIETINLNNDFSIFTPKKELCKRYDWEKILDEYKSLF